MFVLQPLIRAIESPVETNVDHATPGGFVGTAGKDLRRAIDVLRRKRTVPAVDHTHMEPTVLPSAMELDSAVNSESHTRTPNWHADWDASVSIENVSPSVDQAQADMEQYSIGDLFDTLFGASADSVMWDYRSLDLG